LKLISKPNPPAAPISLSNTKVVFSEVSILTILPLKSEIKRLSLLSKLIADGIPIILIPSSFIIVETIPEELIFLILPSPISAIYI
jgi:hypothetical protein